MVAEQYDVDWITASDAATTLGVTKRRVLQLIEAGRLPARKLGWSYLIRRPDLELVAERRWGRPRKDRHYA